MTDGHGTGGASGGAGAVGLAAVGLGRWAHVLANAYRDSDVVSLRTCFSRDPQRRSAFATRFGCDQEESLDALLAREDVEGIIVTAPNDQHAGLIEAAAAAGKHVYTEKPVAVALSDVARIRRAVQSSGVVFACGHSARRLSGPREMKRMLESGEVGEPSMVEATFGNERGLELRPEDWRSDPSACPGGPLTQLGIHQIDNLQYLLGPARRAMAIGQAQRADIANMLAVGVLLEFDNSVGYLGCNWMSPGSFTIDAYCTIARLRYELDFSWWSDSADTDAHTSLTRVAITSNSDDPDNRILGTEAVALPPRDHLKDEVVEFCQAIRGLEPVEVGLDEAIANVLVLQAAAQSLTERRSVEVAEMLELLDAS
ncbi:MAG TPA: Gfo/Idh/MocA family oxidoreductase [Solirubrobacteraceae bacterium]|nr:Gfo/Idh/MocA family oxidoreductase [Solirubrobacteraceae bacterium]